METGPLHTHPNEQGRMERRESDAAKLTALFAFAAVGAAAYLGLSKADSPRLVENSNPETTPQVRILNESLYVTQAREIARNLGTILLTQPKDLSVNPEQVGVGESYPNAIQQGGIIMQRGISKITLDYDNNPFSDGVVTFINQGTNSQGEYITAQHLNRIYFVTPEENTSVQLRQYVYAHGGTNQELLNYTMEAGHEYALIPLISPNPGENSAIDDIQFDPITGGAVHVGGHQTIHTGERDDYVSTSYKGTVLALLKLSPFDPETGNQELSILGVVNDNSIRELRNGGGIGLDRIDYASQTTGD